jgi:hypothetical protein
MASILIIGEDPDLINFDAPDAPPDMTATKVMAGLNGSVERLKAEGHRAMLMLTKTADTIEGQVADALAETPYDVVVIGAGLRTLPPMADQFERLINALHSQASQARLAFNSRPDDSDVAARRWL